MLSCRLLYFILPLLLIVSPSNSRAANSAQALSLAVQSPLGLDGKLPVNNPARCLLNMINLNEETAFSFDPGTCNMPAGAHSVSMAKYSNNDSHLIECGEACTTSSWTWRITVYFSDGSWFNYRIDYQHTVCRDENGVYADARSLNATSEAVIFCNQRPVFVGAAVETESSFGVVTEAKRTGNLRTPSAAGGAVATSPAPQVTEFGELLDDVRTILDGVDDLELRAGDGAGWDLSGLSAAFSSTDTPAAIYADSVITPGGMTIDDLFDPDPVVAPGQSTEAAVLMGRQNPCRIGAGLDTLGVTVENRGTEPLVLDLDYSDTAGWTGAGGTSEVVPVGGFATIDIPVLFPSPQICDSSVVTVLAESGATLFDEHDFRLMAPIDADADGVVNACDNCWDAFNPGQEDANENLEGDVCEPAAIPTLSEWAMILMALVLAVAGAWMLRRRGAWLTS